MRLQLQFVQTYDFSIMCVNDGFPYTYYLVTIHSAQSMPRV